MSARPTAEIGTEERRYQNGKQPRILDIIEIPMLAAVPRGHQQENHQIDATYYWTKTGSWAWDDVGDLMDTPGALWENGSSTYHGCNDQVAQSVAPEFSHSLCLIRPEAPTLQVFAPSAALGNHKRAVRAEFRHNGSRYNLRVTDPIAEEEFLERDDGTYALKGDSYFCVSLAEAHTDGYCYKLVATVIAKELLGG